MSAAGTHDPASSGKARLCAGRSGSAITGLWLSQLQASMTSVRRRTAPPGVEPRARADQDTQGYGVAGLTQAFIHVPYSRPFSSSSSRLSHADRHDSASGVLAMARRFARA